MLDNSVFYDVAQPIREDLDREDLYDLCINKPGEVYLLTADGWQYKQDDQITNAWCDSFVTLVANHAYQKTDRKNPILSTELVSGERIQVVIPPAAKHISITIRRPHSVQIPLTDYVDRGLLKKSRTEDMNALEEVQRAKALYDNADSIEECLRYCIQERLNIIFSGSTGSGKTTIANTLSSLIDPTDRIVSIEDAAEMSFSQPNVVSLFYPRNRKDGGITADDLLASCMRMSPDRIIFGELRGSEAFFYIDQINTGHKGSITTIHANSAEKAVKRLIKLIKRSDEGKGFSNEDIREDIADEVDVIFQWQKHGIDHAYFPGLEGLDDVC